MSAELLSCPYCNTQMSPAEVRIEQGRRLCPRCGEPLPGLAGEPTIRIGPLRSLTLAAGSTRGSKAGVERPGARFPLGYAKQLGVMSLIVLLGSVALRFLFPAESRVFKTAPFMIGIGGIGLVASIWLAFFRLPRSNQGTLQFLLVNMALMIGLGVSYALWTTPQRRQNDPRDLPTGSVAPAQLSALGYLPADATLVSGIHVSELLQQPAGKDFLDQPQWGFIPYALKQIKNWTGLEKDALDHVVVGVREGGTIPLLPRSLTVVVQTRRRYHADSPPGALKKLPALHGKPLYRFQPMGWQGLFVEGLVWCAGDKTLVLVLWSDKSTVADITKTIPPRPRSGALGLAKPLRMAIEEKLKEGMLVWVAGHTTSHQALAVLLPFPHILRDLPRELRNVQTFTIALRFHQKEVTMHSSLHGANEQSARALKRYFDNQSLPGVGSVTAYSTAPELGEMEARTIALSFRPLCAAVLAVGQVAVPHWVTFHVRSDAKTLFGTSKGAKGPFSILPAP